MAYEDAINAALKGDFENIENHLNKQASRLFINAFLEPLTTYTDAKLDAWYKKTVGLSENVSNLADAILIGRQFGQEWFNEYGSKYPNIRIGYIEHSDVVPTKDIFDRLSFCDLTPIEIHWLQGSFYIDRETWMDRIDNKQFVNKLLIHPDEFDMYDAYKSIVLSAKTTMKDWPRERAKNAVSEIFDGVDDQAFDCWVIGKVTKDMCKNWVDPLNIDGDEFIEAYQCHVQSDGEWLKQLVFTREGIYKMLKQSMIPEFVMELWKKVALSPGEIGSHIMNCQNTPLRTVSI